MKKKCKTCGKEFETNPYYKKYCSKECSSIYNTCECGHSNV